MRIDLEVLHSFDLIITTSTSDSECVSEAGEQMLNPKRRSERQASPVTACRSTQQQYLPDRAAPDTGRVHLQALDRFPPRLQQTSQ